MKKLILFTLILSLVLAMPSLAEADEPVRIDWSKEVEQAFVDAGFVGTQYTLHGVGCQLIIPDSYVEQTSTDEDLAHELVFHYADEETGGKIQVYDSIIDGCDDLAGLGEMLKTQYPDRLVQHVVINGVAAIINASEELDTANVIFDMGEHRFVQIVFSPMSKANQLLTLCIASIQFPASEE